MYKSIHAFENNVRNYIVRGQFEKALYAIQSFVEHIVYLPYGAGNILSSSILDELCQTIGAHFFQKTDQSHTGSDLIVYIATQLYTSGGHTAVIEDFIRYQPDKKHCIVMTDIFNLSDKKIIEQRFLQFNVNFLWAPRDNLTTKLKWLQNTLINLQPQKVFMFNHHQDAVTVAAMQPNLVKELCFFHHADYELCLGVHLSHALHIDAQSLGFHNCRHKIGIKNNIYWPLVVADQNYDSARKFLVEGKLITCSSGSPKKFEVPYDYSYIDLVPQILAATKGKHIHIGKLSKKSLEKIYNSLKRYNIPSDRFVHIPWVKSVWESLISQKVDVYLSSFPISGGRTTIEALGSGTPIIMHENYRSEYLGQVYMAYPQVLCWRQPHQLLTLLKEYNSENLKQHSFWAREHYEKYYAPELFEKELTKSANELTGLTPPALPIYQRDELQLFLETYHSINWQNILKKYFLKIIFSHKIFSTLARRGRKIWKERNLNNPPHFKLPPQGREGTS